MQWTVRKDHVNHVEPGVTKVYDRFSYDAEKKAALTWWAAKLKAILEDEDTATNVVPFVAKEA